MSYFLSKKKACPTSNKYEKIGLGLYLLIVYTLKHSEIWDSSCINELITRIPLNEQPS